MLLISSSATVVAQTAQDLNAWTYQKEWDKLTNLNYSLARSPLPERGLYDNLRLEVICKDNRLEFVVDANSLITSQGRVFDFEYQIDKNQPVIIQMRTFADTKRRGYTDEQIERIVKDMLSGQSIFIRINTLIRTVLSGAIPLDGAAKPVHRVLADCGVRLPDHAIVDVSYSLADFERDFKQLTPEQQRHLLIRIKKILHDIQ